MHPDMHGLDPDSSEASTTRAAIIRNKSALKSIYAEWYASLAAAVPKSPDGRVLEIGAGGGFLGKYIPGLITSEIDQVPNVDLIASGQQLSVKDSSLRAIVMLDVLHHLPRVLDFFSEAQRCLMPGGAIVMVEPWVTSWSRFVYRYLHQEPFDPETDQWHFPERGPMTQANSALPWMIFARDRNAFQHRFQSLEISAITLNGGFSYLLTGGVTYRQIMPDWIITLVKKMESRLACWNSLWALFAKIIIKKRTET